MPQLEVTQVTQNIIGPVLRKNICDHNGNLLKFTQATQKWEVGVRQDESWSNQRLISLGMYRNCVHRNF